MAEALKDQHTVHSLDHVAIHEGVLAVDMAHTTLEEGCLDIALFSLSLMGSNITDYIQEAFRTLKLDGRLHIWEATSRFSDVDGFCRSLEAMGFEVARPKQKDRFTFISALKTRMEASSAVSLNL